MLKKLKNSEILDLAEGVYRINNSKIESTKRFSYSVILNSSTLENRAKAILEISKPSESYAEYEKRREELISEYAMRDEDGEIILRDGRFVKIDPLTKEVLNDKITALDEEFKDVLNKREQDLKDFEALLDEEVEIDIQTVSLEDVPDDVGKDINLLKMIMKMVD